MSEQHPESPRPTSLRQKAEAYFLEREDLSQENLADLSPESLRTILHELRVHQIEMKVQNEEMMRVQAGLTASRAHFFDLYDLAPVGYCTISEAGLILEVNLTAATLLGLDPRALVKQPFSRFIIKEDQDIFYLLINQPLETGSPTFDLRMVKPDGTTFWANLKKVSAHGENGEPLRRIVLSDISWRKLAEEDVRSLNAELRASEERLHELNALGELLLPQNPIEKKFKHVTDTLVRVFDADFARIWIIKPGDRCNTDCIHAQLTEGPHVCRFRDKCLHLLASSGRYTHTDGGAHARVPFGCYKIGKIAAGEESGFLTNEVTTDPRVHDHAWAKELGLTAFAGYCLVDADGTPVGVMALFSKQAISKNQDLLLRGFAHLAALTLIAARSEETLRTSEERMRLASEAAGIGVWDWDVRSRMIRWDKRMFSIYGLPETPSGTVPHDMWRASVLPEEIAEQEVRLQGTVAAVGNNQREFQILRSSDRAVRVIQSSEMALRDPGGEVARIVGINIDITERKTLEDSLAKALLQANTASNAKSEFLGIMSHELRNPLTGVLGFAEILSDTDLDDEQKDYVRMISSSGEHLLAVVNDTLDFSSIEAGTLAIHAAPFDLAHLMKLSSDIVRKSSADKGLAFHCDVAADVPAQITGDERRIRQILVNLLANAVKFTSDGSVSLRVTRSGEFLDFSVEDTGLGISSEALAHLFQLFTQADSTISQKYGGTGIGLAVSRRLAEAMGGTISVVSAPGKGSTFTFHFPMEGPAGGRAPSHLLLGADGASPSSPSAETPVRPDRLPVLVVEDDRNSRTLAGKLIQSLGYRVEFAANGLEAVEAFAPGKYLAILMDLRMPVMNGFEAAAIIRSRESGSRVPIIVLSANVLPGSREIYLAAGMDDYLAKPFKMEELAAKLACVAQIS